jgi:hypothetical protein
LDGGDEIAQRAAIIDVPSGNGHVLLFSTNPFWRGQTKGSYFLQRDHELGQPQRRPHR